MSTPLMLNLDELTTDLKAVVLNGTTHSAVEMTTEQFIQKAAAAKTIETSDNMTFVEKAEASVAFLLEMFPTIKRDELVSLPLRKLTAFITFAMTAPADIAKGAEVAQAGNV